MAPGPEEKRVYLVRHAQSQQNVAVAQLYFNGDIAALGRVLRLGYDAPLSEAGTVQLQDAAEKLGANQADGGFAKERGIELVAHSPYQRAKHTAQALFPQFFGTERMVELPPMHERTIPEYFFPALMEERVRQVRQWIEGRRERTLALVGHGQFFKMCMGGDRKQLRNVSIMETTYNAETGFTAADAPLAFEGYPEPDVRRKEESPISDR
jgi:phosphohistidine phosphatase SixA